MTKKTKQKTASSPALSDEDAALWDQVAGNVRPLSEKAKNIARATPTDPAPPPVEATAPPPQKSTMRPASTPPPLPAPAAPPPQLEHGTVAGLDKRTARRMKRGTLKPEARLDLHGKTQAEAHVALRHFILSAHAAGKRQVLVITGKGARSDDGGVLKTRVPIWLNGIELREKIVAFDYAQPKDGGAGALYVRLRRIRDDGGRVE